MSQITRVIVTDAVDAERVARGEVKKAKISLLIKLLLSSSLSDSYFWTTARAVAVGALAQTSTENDAGFFCGG